MVGHFIDERSHGSVIMISKPLKHVSSDQTNDIHMNESIIESVLDKR